MFSQDNPTASFSILLLAMLLDQDDATRSGSKTFNQCFIDHVQYSIALSVIGTYLDSAVAIGHTLSHMKTFKLGT